MRRIISLILVLFMVLSLFVGCNDTADEPKNTTAEITETTDLKIDKETAKPLTESLGLTFVSNGDGTCYVSSIGYCTDKNIVFPTISPDGDTVTSIANHAFYSVKNIQSIVVPESVVSIGRYAFCECSDLLDVVILGSEVVLGVAAFSGCEKLESVTMKGIVNIEDYTFSNCKSLESLTLYSGLKSIGYKAFGECVSLESVNIPEGVEVIEGYAFYGCEKITSMIIPNSVTNISGGVFAGCKNLTDISVDSGNVSYVSVNNCIISKHKNELIAVCNEFTIPNDLGIVSIEKDAISQVNVTNITIPKSITELKFMAIIGCENLKDIFYEGTTEEWNLVNKDDLWLVSNKDCLIHCTNDIITTAS